MRLSKSKKHVLLIVALLALVYCFVGGIFKLAALDNKWAKARDEALIEQGRREVRAEHNYKESDVIYVDGIRYVPAS